MKTKINYTPLLDALKDYDKRWEIVKSYRQQVEYAKNQYARLPERAGWARGRAEKAIGEFWMRRENLVRAEEYEAQYAAGEDKFIEKEMGRLNQTLDNLEAASDLALQAVLDLAPLLGWEVSLPEPYPVHEFPLAVITADGKTAKDFLAYADSVRRARQIKRENSRSALEEIRVAGIKNEDGCWQVLRETLIKALKPLDGKLDVLLVGEQEAGVKPIRELLKILDCETLTICLDESGLELHYLTAMYTSPGKARSKAHFTLHNLSNLQHKGQLALPIIFEDPRGE